MLKFIHSYTLENLYSQKVTSLKSFQSHWKCNFWQAQDNCSEIVSDIVPETPETILKLSSKLSAKLSTKMFMKFYTYLIVPEIALEIYPKIFPEIFPKIVNKILSILDFILNGRKLMTKTTDLWGCTADLQPKNEVLILSVYHHVYRGVF